MVAKFIRALDTSIGDCLQDETDKCDTNQTLTEWRCWFEMFSFFKWKHVEVCGQDLYLSQFGLRFAGDLQELGP